ncbi:MAG: sigma-54-dependent Fis family transcriptional regulator [Firmicutes bacterium]|nr:sigma-54-dependent Fis family transcriptional regulator [Bacillota bacterium]
MVTGPDWSHEIQVILDAIREGLLAVDRKGRITLFNRAAEQIIGVPARDALGCRVDQVVPNTRLHIVLKTGRPEIDQRQEVGNTTILTSRLPVRDRDGTLIGVVAVFRDITEIIKLAEQITSLKETQMLLQEIINSTQDAISVVDENGIGILINDAYTNLIGLTAEEVVDKPATVDIAEGESVHMRVLRTRRAYKSVSMKAGPHRKEVLVDAAPIIVNGVLKGSVAVVHDVSQIHRLSGELEGARRLIRRLEAKYIFEDIIGTSREIREAVEKSRQVAATPATVILRGESGTGKELFAHAIHQASRRQGQFVRVNCAAIPETLLESELFGYVEGAFTGAKRGGRRGYFEEASRGTLFLDEITEITSGVQAKLLRVLQEREIVRVGDNAPVPVDVRVVTATNADLEKLVASGRFRDDLYYRLNVVPINIPPLRRRKTDIPLLVEFILRKLNTEFGRNVANVSGEAMEALMRYHWPGNVRELENVLGRAMISMHFGETIVEFEHLPPLGLSTGSPVPGDSIRGYCFNYNRETYSELRDRWEREVLAATLEHTGGNRTRAAEMLQISLRSLYNKLKKHGLS